MPGAKSLEIPVASGQDSWLVSSPIFYSEVIVYSIDLKRGYFAREMEVTHLYQHQWVLAVNAMGVLNSGDLKEYIERKILRTTTLDI
ncbi:hypothetical protein NPIL_40501 [Nephila pilipes]|uniref:Uncharacterized protein n=1 Tax=Nephila pilipes TaxID=299642 RepID=A0A8X6Q2B8_NEPPI|nr:hypothetical protein NPIL_40501 [Nephila pilipes]